MIDTRPQEGDCSSYFMRYINLVEGSNILQSFEDSLSTTLSKLKSIPTNKWDHAYATGKWTIKEMLIHLIDTERIFAYRALRIARNDQTELPGFDQDEFMLHVDASTRSKQSILDEYELVRRSSFVLFKNLTKEMWNRKSIVSNHQISVLAIAYLTLGHEIHHLKVLDEKYLN